MVTKRDDDDRRRQAAAITFVQVTAQIYAKLRKSHFDFFRNWFHISFYTQAASQILLSSSPTSGERRGGKVALSQLPPFLGFEQKYFNGEFLEH